MATSRGLSFTTTMWVIDWVHNNTTNGWAATLPTGTTSLAPADIGLFCVTDSSNGRAATNIYISDFTGWHAELRVWTILRNQLDAGSSRTCDSCAAAWSGFDCVNHCSNWDIAKWQVVAWLDIRTWAILDLGPLSNAIWSDDVTLLAICKVKKSDSSGTIWVVLDMRDCCRDAIFIVP